MPQYELNFYDYWRIIRKRKITIGVVFIIVFLVTFVCSTSQKQKYKAFIEIKVLQRGLGKNLISEYFFWTPYNLASQEEVIKGWAVAERAAKKMGWDKNIEPEKFRQLVNRLRENISTEVINNTNIIRISVISDTPQLSIKVAKAVAQAYIGENLYEKSRQVRTVSNFVYQQSLKAVKNLEDSQKKLIKFKQKGDFDKISRLKERLSSLELQLVRLLKKPTSQETLFVYQQSLKAVKNLEDSQRKLEKFKQEKNINQLRLLKKRLSDLELQLPDLLKIYTLQHPDVVQLNYEIKLIKEQLEDSYNIELQFVQLTQDVEDNKEMVRMLKKRYKETLIAEAGEVTDVAILNPATTASPIKPDIELNALLGSVVGLMLGLILAFVKENLDTSIETIEEVEALLDTPVLGVIPHIKTKETKRFFIWKRDYEKVERIKQLRTHLVTQLNPKSTAAEAFHSLRTNLQALDSKKKALLFTSAGPKEGKSIIIANCAIAAAQMGQKTVLIDSDLRKPTIHEIFGIEKEPGLSDILLGSMKFEEVLKNLADIIVGDLGWEVAFKSRGMNYLNIITSGHIPSNSAELLNSQRMTNLIEELKKKFDLLLFDTPPTLPVTDSVILGPKTDGVVLIYEAGKTAKGALRRAKIQLETVNAKILGAILNNIKASEAESSAGYYHYQKYYKYYTHET